MISSATTPAVAKAKRFASPDGAARTATSRFVPRDASMERANDQVFVNAATAIKAQDATNANHILDARMASARGPGSVAAIKTGVAFSATKVSDKANTLLI